MYQITNRKKIHFEKGGISMDKKWIICIIIVIVLGLGLGISFAFLSQVRNNVEDTELLSEKELANTKHKTNTQQNMIFENNIYINENKSNFNEVNAVETANTEDNISPNAIIVKKVYYEACDHLTREVEDIPEELVNKTQSDIEEAFPGWTVEEYSPTEIVLYKTDKGNCGEHYFVQDHNGVIGIYTTDEYGVKTLKEDTEIATQYLPEADLENLKAGVEIIGHTKLIEFLEDYE